MEVRNIKLIWDFRGQDAHKTALHHEIHLNEFLVKNTLPDFEVGVEQITEMHSLAYLITDQSNMIVLRDALVPHIGQQIEV